MGTSGNRVAVVGGGINGAGIAWELVRRGYDVTLFEKGRCGEQTSSKTTKMIHGGLRYLERLHVGLVRESLRDRAWLLKHAPGLVKPLEIVLPIFDDSPRSRATVRSGLILYDALAGRANIRRHRSMSVAEIRDRGPVSTQGLRGGFSYWDAQVDDLALVRAVVAAAQRDGATILEFTRVSSLRREAGEWLIRANDEEYCADFLINAAGPWMNELLDQNGMKARYVLSLVRGSHIVLHHRISESGFLLQSISDHRVFFALPWKETTLVGTTEVIHRAPLDDVRASDDEVDYLLVRFNRYFERKLTRRDVSSTFAGVRPLVGRASNPSAIGRDYRVVRTDNLINVFGGKMTTFMSLADKVALRVDNYFGVPRKAREPVFTP